MVRNGIDTQTGDVLVWAETLSRGAQLAGAIAVEEQIEALGPDVIPLHEAITNEDIPLPERKLPDTSDWTPEDCQEWGRWAVGVLREAKPPVAFNRTHARRLRAIGAGPVTRQLGPFTEFRAGLGVKIIPEGAAHARNTARERPEFFKWPTNRFVRYASYVAERVGRRPRATDYDAYSDRQPSAWAIRMRFGSVAALNEYIGYPNYAEWQPADYIEYGVRFIKANSYDTDIFVPHFFDVAAQNERGPWRDRAAKVFNSWGEYKMAVLKAYHSERAQKTKHYRALMDIGRLPEAFRDLTAGQLDQAAAIYLVIAGSAINISESERVDIALTTPIAELLPKLKKHKKTLTQNSLIATATQIGIYDDLFPPPYAQYLTLTVDEIEAAIIKSRIHNANQRRRRGTRGVDTDQSNELVSEVETTA
jgi:hypothetical protein